MKQAGLYLLMFGFETGDSAMLMKINKQAKLIQARKVMEMVKKLNIFTLGFFILGLPGETKESCLRTIARVALILPQILRRSQ